RADFFRSQSQYAGLVGDSAGEAPVAPTHPGRSEPRHGQTRLRAGDGARVVGGRRGRLARRSASRSGSRPVRWGAVVGFGRVRETSVRAATAGRTPGQANQLMVQCSSGDRWARHSCLATCGTRVSRLLVNPANVPRISPQTDCRFTVSWFIHML